MGDSLVVVAAPLPLGSSVVSWCGDASGERSEHGEPIDCRWTCGSVGVPQTRPSQQHQRVIPVVAAHERERCPDKRPQSILVGTYALEITGALTQQLADELGSPISVLARWPPRQHANGGPELVRELLRERTRDLKGVCAHEDRLRTLVGAPLSLVRRDHWYDSLVLLGRTSLWNTHGAASPPAVDRLAMFRPFSGGVAAPTDHRRTKRQRGCHHNQGVAHVTR